MVASRPKWQRARSAGFLHGIFRLFKPVWRGNKQPTIRGVQKLTSFQWLSAARKYISIIYSGQTCISTSHVPALGVWAVCWDLGARRSQYALVPIIFAVTCFANSTQRRLSYLLFFWGLNLNKVPGLGSLCYCFAKEGILQLQTLRGLAILGEWV